jgi:methionyl aminopeptidase
MMITIKSQREIDRMREAGKITAAARSVGRKALRDGVTTDEINHEIHKFILSCGATPTFLGYGGFPKSACISVNDEVIHGIPGKRVIHNGDIVSIDVGATYKGYVGDCAGTFPVGEVSPEAEELIRITRASFFEGIKFARKGNRLFDISAAIQQYAESFGCGVVREYVGHGIGSNMHEDPEVPNYVPPRGERRVNPRLIPGMTLAIEPMINRGSPAVRVLSNDWTVVTVDHSLSAHYENTILITDGDPEILTIADDI